MPSAYMSYARVIANRMTKADQAGTWRCAVALRIEDYGLLGDCIRRRWWGGTGRSTGCACRVSTLRRALRRCSVTNGPGSGGWHQRPVACARADVVRVVEGVSGRVPMRLALRLRFDYGRIVPWVRHYDGQLAAVAGPDAAWLSSPVPLHGEDMTSYADFTVSPGQRMPFVLTHRPSHEPVPQPLDAQKALAETETFWAD